MIKVKREPTVFIGLDFEEEEEGLTRRGSVDHFLEEVEVGGLWVGGWSDLIIVADARLEDFEEVRLAKTFHK